MGRHALDEKEQKPEEGVTWIRARAVFPRLWRF